MADPNSSRLHHTPNPWALTPLVVFLLSYLVVSIIAGDFYKMPITVAFVIASVVAIAHVQRGQAQQSDRTILPWSGQQQYYADGIDLHSCRCFRPNSQSDGAVDATVNLAMSILPGNLLAAGIFLAACFFPFPSDIRAGQSLLWLLLP